MRFYGRELIRIDACTVPCKLMTFRWKVIACHSLCAASQKASSELLLFIYLFILFYLFIYISICAEA